MQKQSACLDVVCWIDPLNLHRRIAEEQSELERLACEGDSGSQAPSRNPKQMLEEVRQPQD